MSVHASLHLFAKEHYCTYCKSKLKLPGTDMPQSVTNSQRMEVFSTRCWETDHMHFAAHSLAWRPAVRRQQQHSNEKLCQSSPAAPWRPFCLQMTIYLCVKFSRYFWENNPQVSVAGLIKAKRYKHKGVHIFVKHVLGDTFFLSVASLSLSYCCLSLFLLSFIPTTTQPIS